MAGIVQPRFSDGEDGNRLMAETAALLESKWALDETQQGLEKTFNFPTYAKALKFNRLTASPQSYKSVFYHWTTHEPRGLSSKDIHMARLCDDKANLLGHSTGSETVQKSPTSVA
ncbi:hypothetical protein HO133_000599 [Letharia lupina]|uniref:4a-hydroxytetrahydrobiopterin dehydratase n=1 Tax=Letharia lupina TaxID=560253 RepID=A0A8H6CFJ1_9LECA|nr:uncharacterized protein HO133_000599 [Letharia lupina]KAF6222554.1 hypothetical protein HO133_000599 [Letharia lupina]